MKWVWVVTGPTVTFWVPPTAARARVLAARRLQVATNGPYRGHRAGDRLSRLDRSPNPIRLPHNVFVPNCIVWGKGKAAGLRTFPAALLCRSTLRAYTAVVGPEPFAILSPPVRQP